MWHNFLLSCRLRLKNRLRGQLSANRLNATRLERRGGGGGREREVGGVGGEGKRAWVNQIGFMHQTVELAKIPGKALSSSFSPTLNLLPALNNPSSRLKKKENRREWEGLKFLSESEPHEGGERERERKTEMPGQLICFFVFRLRGKKKNFFLPLSLSLSLLPLSLSLSLLPLSLSLLPRAARKIKYSEAYNCAQCLCLYVCGVCVCVWGHLCRSYISRLNVFVARKQFLPSHNSHNSKVELFSWVSFLLSRSCKTLYFYYWVIFFIS